MSDAERMILKMLSEGKITVEESERLLNAMKKGDNNENSGYTRRVYDDEDDEPRKKRKASPQDFINPFIQSLSYITISFKYNLYLQTNFIYFGSNIFMESKYIITA